MDGKIVSVSVNALIRIDLKGTAFDKFVQRGSGPGIDIIGVGVLRAGFAFDDPYDVAIVLLIELFLLLGDSPSLADLASSSSLSNVFSFVFAAARRPSG